MGLAIEPPYLIIKPFVSEEEFYRQGDEDTDWEYLDGRIVMHTPASDRHEDLFAFLVTLLRAYVDETGRGVVRGSRLLMRLDPRWSPEPDLLVVRPERRHLLTSTRLEGPADFIIEIASDSDPSLDLREKLPRYREAGIEEMWFVDRFDNVVRVERKESAGYTSTTLASGRLESRVVQGFWIEVPWLWREPLPPTLGCLRQILGSI